MRTELADDVWRLCSVGLGLLKGKVLTSLELTSLNPPDGTIAAETFPVAGGTLGGGPGFSFEGGTYIAGYSSRGKGMILGLPVGRGPSPLKTPSTSAGVRLQLQNGPHHGLK